MIPKILSKAPEDDDDIQEYEWVNRHPWRSWRERYVKNKRRFNRLIDRFVARQPLAPRVVDRRERRARRSDVISEVDSDHERLFSEDEDIQHADNHDATPAGSPDNTRGSRTGKRHASGRSKSPIDLSSKRRRTANNREKISKRRSDEPSQGRKQEKGKGRADPFTPISQKDGRESDRE
jgi:hypothetical protein